MRNLDGGYRTRHAGERSTAPGRVEVTSPAKPCTCDSTPQGQRVRNSTTESRAGGRPGHHPLAQLCQLDVDGQTGGTVDDSFRVEQDAGVPRATHTLGEVAQGMRDDEHRTTGVGGIHRGRERGTPLLGRQVS